MRPPCRFIFYIYIYINHEAFVDDYVELRYLGEALKE